MALPTILVNVSGGSDSAASGAGPGTALSGSAAATDGTNGLTITITDGVVDLSGVAVDGSAVLYINDTTAGKRNFCKIASISGSVGNWTVVVAGSVLGDGFMTSLTGKSWAIGGKRATGFSSTSSVKLTENNGASGDAMPGWIIEMESGHTETIAATIAPRRSGDATSGPIIVRGTSGAPTPPIVSFSNNGDAFQIRAQFWTFRDFEMQNTFSGTHNASTAFNTNFGYLTFINIKSTHATNKFNTFLTNFGSLGNPLTVQDCNIAHTTSHAISLSSSLGAICRLTNNDIVSCGGNGFIYSATGAPAVVFEGNTFAFNAGDGINLGNSASQQGWVFQRNVFHGNGSDGIEMTHTGANLGGDFLFAENNRFTLNGGYGFNFSGSGVSDTVLSAISSRFKNSNFFGNSLGKYNGITIASSLEETTTDPSGGLASATKDYAGVTGGTNFMSAVDKGLGYPTVNVGTSSSSRNYQDIGLGHQDVGGAGGGILINPGLSGGLR